MDDFGDSVARHELVLRRYTKTGWLIVAAGILVPVLAAAGAYRGLRLTQLGRTRAGLPLLVVGAVVFTARLALWAHTGFGSAF